MTTWFGNLSGNPENPSVTLAVVAGLVALIVAGIQLARRKNPLIPGVLAIAYGLTWLSMTSSASNEATYAYGSIESPFNWWLYVALTIMVLTAAGSVGVFVWLLLPKSDKRKTFRETRKEKKFTWPFWVVRFFWADRRNSSITSNLMVYNFILATTVAVSALAALPSVNHMWDNTNNLMGIAFVVLTVFYMYYLMILLVRKVRGRKAASGS